MHHSGRTRVVKVWDLPVRLFHWGLVALVAALWASGEFGKLDIHMQLGAGALALVLFRLGWGIAGSRTARFADFVRGPATIVAHLRGAVPCRVGHNPLGALSVVLLLALVLAQAASGLFTSDDIFTEGPLARFASADTVSLLSTVHRAGFKLLLAAIGLHLAAIVFYRLVKRENLVTPMITGVAPAPEGAEGNSGGSPATALLLAAASAALVWGGLAAVG
ncbi:MAG: cytochrome b/b6 domain-containing protein [Pseudomonadota bacterium]